MPPTTSRDITPRRRYTTAMRNVPPFSCPSCGTSSAAGVRCPQCGGPVTDAVGTAPLRPSRLGVTAPGIVGSAREWFAERASRRRIAHCREQSGPARAIVDTGDGTVRVRGRVRIVAAVRAPDYTLVAAFRVRRIGDSRKSSPPHPSPTRRPLRRWIEEESACGVFLVDDGSGIALVDDDAFDLEALEVVPLPAAADGTLTLREGDLVEVIGPARRTPPPAEMVAAGRVDDSPLLRFEGRADARLLLLPLPLTAPLPMRRFKSIGPSAPGSPVTREHEALSELEAAGRAQAETRRRTGGGH